MDPTVQHCPGQANIWGAIQACTLLLRSPQLQKPCRLLQAGEEVLWQEEFENTVVYFLFDGNGGAQEINVERAVKVDIHSRGTDGSMQTR